MAFQTKARAEEKKIYKEFSCIHTHTQILNGIVVVK